MKRFAVFLIAALQVQGACVEWFVGPHNPEAKQYACTGNFPGAYVTQWGTVAVPLHEASAYRAQSKAQTLGIYDNGDSSRWYLEFWPTYFDWEESARRTICYERNE